MQGERRDSTAAQQNDGAPRGAVVVCGNLAEGSQVRSVSLPSLAGIGRTSAPAPD